MNTSDVSLRTPLALSGRNQKGATICFEGFRCENVHLISSEGASGLVYEGESPDYYGEGAPSAKLILKECYPIDLAPWIKRVDDKLVLDESAPNHAIKVLDDAKNQFRDAFKMHAELFQNAIHEQATVPSKAFEANGTVYIVSDANNGEILSDYVTGMSAHVQIKVLIRLCETLAAIHDAGYVYLDLKPSNVMVVRNSDDQSRDAFTGEVRLFDFGSVISLEDLQGGNARIFGSGDWSAYEQTHTFKKQLVGTKSDIYSIGALLFWMLMRRPPSTSEVISAYGDWHFSWDNVSSETFKNMGESAATIVNDIFNKTLAVDPAMRYEDARATKEDLRRLAEFATPSSFTLLESFSGMLSPRFDSIQDSIDALRDALPGAFFVMPPNDRHSIRDVDNASKRFNIGEYTPDELPSLIPAGQLLESPWFVDDNNHELNLNILSDDQRNILSCMAFAPEQGFLVSSFMTWCCLENNQRAFDVLCHAGYINLDYTGQKCKLSSLLTRRAAFGARANDETVDVFEENLWRYCNPFSFNVFIFDTAENAAIIHREVISVDDREDNRALRLARAAVVMSPAAGTLMPDESKGENMEMATALIDEALDIVGTTPSKIDACKTMVLLLASIINAEGNPQKALELGNECLAICHSDPSKYKQEILWAYTSLAHAYAQLKQYTEACDSLNNCLEHGRYDITKNSVIGAFAASLEIPNELLRLNMQSLLQSIDSLTSSESIAPSANLLACLGFATSVIRGHFAFTTGSERKEQARRATSELTPLVVEIMNCVSESIPSFSREFTSFCFVALASSADQGFNEELFWQLFDTLKTTSSAANQTEEFVDTCLLVTELLKNHGLHSIAEKIQVELMHSGLHNPDSEAFFSVYNSFVDNSLREEEVDIPLMTSVVSTCKEHAGDSMEAFWRYFVSTLAVAYAYKNSHDDANALGQLCDSITFSKMLLEAKPGLLHEKDHAATYIKSSIVFQLNAMIKLTESYALKRFRSSLDISSLETPLRDTWFLNSIAPEITWLTEYLLAIFKDDEWISVSVRLSLIEKALRYRTANKSWMDTILQAGEIMQFIEQACPRFSDSDIFNAALVAMYLGRAFAEEGDDATALDSFSIALDYIGGTDFSPSDYGIIATFTWKKMLTWLGLGKSAHTFSTIDQAEKYCSILLRTKDIELRFFATSLKTIETLLEFSKEDAEFGEEFKNELLKQQNLHDEFEQDLARQNSAFWAIIAEAAKHLSSLYRNSEGNY